MTHKTGLENDFIRKVIMSLLFEAPRRGGREEEEIMWRRKRVGSEEGGGGEESSSSSPRRNQNMDELLVPLTRLLPVAPWLLPQGVTDVIQCEITLSESMSTSESVPGGRTGGSHSQKLEKIVYSWKVLKNECSSTFWDYLWIKLSNIFTYSEKDLVR